MHLELLTECGALYPQWSPDRKNIYFIGSGEWAGNIWELSIEDGAERPVTDLAGRLGSLGPIAMATDGQHIFFTWGEDIGDLWVTEVEGNE